MLIRNDAYNPSVGRTRPASHCWTRSAGSALHVHIFRGPGQVFGFTADRDGRFLPSQYAPWTAFKAVELHQGEHTPGVDADACLRDLDTFGVHITDAHVRITEDAIGPAARER